MVKGKEKKGNINRKERRSKQREGREKRVEMRADCFNTPQLHRGHQEVIGRSRMIQAITRYM